MRLRIISRQVFIKSELLFGLLYATVVPSHNHWAVIALLGIITGFSTLAPTSVAAQTPQTPQTPPRPPGIANLIAGGGSERFNVDPTFEAKDRKMRLLREQGRALYAAGKLPEAAQRFEESMRLMPDTVGLLWELADIYERTGRTQDELELFRFQVERWHDKNTKPLLTYALLLVKTKHPQEAAAQYHAALSGLPRRDDLVVPLELRFDNSFVPTPRLEAAIETGLGMLEYLPGHREEALVHLKRAVVLYPKFATAQYYLGATLRESPKATDRASANQALQKAVDYGTPAIRSAVNKLTKP